MTMEYRWFWTIGAVLMLAGAALYPNVYQRIWCAIQSAWFTIVATLMWRDYLAWREVWLADQCKGMPE